MAHHLSGDALGSICKKIFVPPPLSELIKTDEKEAQFLVLNNIKQELEGTPHITCKDVESSYNYSRRKQCVNLKIKIASLHDYIHDLAFELNFNDEAQLVIDSDYYRKKYFFRNVNQLTQLKDAIQKKAFVEGQKHAIIDGEALKKAKIKDFKKNAIISKIIAPIPLF